MACFRRLYYDVTQSAVPATLRSVMEVADPSRILFGSDYPFARFPVKDLKETIEGVESFDGFDAAQRRAVFRDNAVALFPRFRS
jgi:predicted TIM-barrel fold metal-dependent hydrolase